MKKVTKKTTKKTVIPTPDYVIDITNDLTVEDVNRSIAEAKVDYYFTSDNIGGIVDTILDGMFANNNLVAKLSDGERIAANVEFHPLGYAVMITPKGTAVNVVKKKPNVFKRFWNWITRKK